MDFAKLSATWLELQTSLRKPPRALVVDDEPVVRDLLRDILKISKTRFDVEVAETAEGALQLLRSLPFDILVTDKNLPGHDGVELIEQVKSEGMNIRCVLVTGYPSVETISRALASGADDYIAKPFDDVRHVLKRIEFVVEQHREDSLFQRIVHDLQAAVEEDPTGSQFAVRMAKALFHYDHALRACPDVMLVDDDPMRGQFTTLFLKGGGLNVVYSRDPKDARERVTTAQPPKSIFVHLDAPGALQLIEDLHKSDPYLGIVVSGSAARLNEAIAAVGAGACDFVLGASEGLDPLASRVKRAVARGQRRRLYREIISTVLKAAGDHGPNAEDMLQDLMKRAGMSPTSSEAIITSEVDLSDLSGQQDPSWLQAPEDGPMAQPAPEVPAGAVKVNEGRYTTIEEQVEYGLDQIDAKRTVELPLRDVMYVCGALEELIRYFHEPANYPDIPSLRAFLGDLVHGGLATMIHTYYDVLRPKLPADVRSMMKRGKFDHPRPPAYLKPKKGVN